MVTEITKLVNETKNNLANAINKSFVYVYWNIRKNWRKSDENEND